MRGLNIILRKIGFTTMAQQQNIAALLQQSGCFEEQTLRQTLKSADYPDSLIEKLVGYNPQLALMDEIDEEEEKKLLTWLSISTKQAAQRQSSLPLNIYSEIYNAISNITSTMNVTSHLKYDVAIIFGQTQETIDTKSKNTKTFLKEKHIAVQTIFTDKAGDTKEILASCTDLIENQNEFVRQANISSVYKAIYFLAKTNRLLIISSQENLMSDTKAVQEFFANNPSSLSVEIICTNSSSLTPKKILEQLHYACTKVVTEKTEYSSYFSTSNIFYYGATVGSYAFNMFYRQTVAPNITSVAEPYPPSYKN